MRLKVSLNPPSMFLKCLHAYTFTARSLLFGIIFISTSKFSTLNYSKVILLKWLSYHKEGLLLLGLPRVVSDELFILL